MSDVGAIIALWGSIVTTLGGICFAVVKYLQWNKQNTSAYKDLEKRVSAVERKVDDHSRQITDCADDAKGYEKRSTEAIDKLTEWVKWMFSNGKK